jgi:YidC/Oxa1 family membrane protein insertase
MDNRRLVLFLIFSLSSMLLWDAWQKQHAPAPAATAQTASAQQGVPSPKTDLPAAAAAGGVPVASTAPKAEMVTVKTDLFEADISTLGGSITRLDLLAHKSIGDNDRPFELFGEEHRYQAQTGLIGDGQPNHRTVFKLLPGPRALAEGQDSVTVRLEAATAGEKVTKLLTFHRGSYVIDTAYEIANLGSQPIAPHAYFQMVRDDKKPEGESRMVSTFTGPAFYTEQGKYAKIDFSDIEKNKASKIPPKGGDGWAAMVQHYFVSAWLPQGDTEREFFANKVANGEYSAGLILPVASIAPGATGKLEVPLFAGPQEQKLLESPREGLTAPGFDLVVDYGWLTIIAKPLFWVLGKIHALAGNWGWAIIGLTVLIKLLFFPLSAASYKSMAKMRQVTPRLQQLKERHGDDRAKLNQEMMDLYRKEKINPLGGCLPILIQIPVFISLYWVLLGAVEMRHAPWLLWITDLASQDPYYVLPVIMVISMIIQTKLNPTPPDPVQAKVMMFMPFMFGAMFFFFPSGLVLYWVVNNVLSIAQQWQITRMIEGGKQAG